MSHEPATVPVKKSFAEEVGIDRAFVLQMAQVPLFATLFVALNYVSHLVWGTFLPNTRVNLGPMVLLSALMILSAAIDGYAFKVPNWLTLSIVVSGWVIGLLHVLQVPIDSGTGGLGTALLGSLIGFALIVPMLFLGGMGEGDVKMQMGFGSWIGAFYGMQGMMFIVYAFCAGAIIGGIFGVIIIIMRGRYLANAEIMKGMAQDVTKIASGKVEEGQQDAWKRRKDWVRLPYGVPLCVGFVGFLIYKYTLGGG